MDEILFEFGSRRSNGGASEYKISLSGEADDIEVSTLDLLVREFAYRTEDKLTIGDEAASSRGDGTATCVSVITIEDHESGDHRFDIVLALLDSGTISRRDGIHFATYVRGWACRVGAGRLLAACLRVGLENSADPWSDKLESLLEGGVDESDDDSIVEGVNVRWTKHATPALIGSLRSVYTEAGTALARARAGGSGAASPAGSGGMSRTAPGEGLQRRGPRRTEEQAGPGRDYQEIIGGAGIALATDSSKQRAEGKSGEMPTTEYSAQDLDQRRVFSDGPVPSDEFFAAPTAVVGPDAVGDQATVRPAAWGSLRHEAQRPQGSGETRPGPTARSSSPVEHPEINWPQAFAAALITSLLVSLLGCVIVVLLGRQGLRRDSGQRLDTTQQVGTVLPSCRTGGARPCILHAADEARTEPERGPRAGGEFGADSAALLREIEQVRSELREIRENLQTMSSRVGGRGPEGMEIAVSLGLSEEECMSRGAKGFIGLRETRSKVSLSGGLSWCWFGDEDLVKRGK